MLARGAFISVAYSIFSIQNYLFENTDLLLISSENSNLFTRIENPLDAVAKESNALGAYNSGDVCCLTLFSCEYLSPSIPI